MPDNRRYTDGIETPVTDQVPPVVIKHI